MLILLTMCIPMTSCSDDDEDEPQQPSIAETAKGLPGTKWSYTDKYDYDGITYTENYSIAFKETTAVYTLAIIITDGKTTQSTTDAINYEYVYSNGLVIFKPLEANKAYLEGKITSDIKMDVTNTSTGGFIGTFYKE